MKNHLTNRWQRAKVNASFSNWTELLLGVPQVQFLGRYSLIYILMIFFYVTESTYVCNYADVTTFYACDSDICNPIKRLEHDSH